MGVRPIQKVIVPLDGSPLAEGAVPYACTLVKHQTAEIVFVSVFPDESWWPNQEVRLAFHRAEQASRFAADIRSEVRFGDPADEILKLARVESADLIVMTTHGLTGNSRLVRGSVAETVMSESPIPVSAVKAAEWMGNIDVSRPIDHLILPIDGSWRSAQVEEMAARLAIGLVARVTIYHVRERPEKPDVSVFKQLHSALTQLGLDVEIIVHRGDPQIRLRNFAALYPTSLVVMCSRGPGVLPDRPRGSVADYVLRHGRAPIVVVPPSEKRESLATVYPSLAA